MNNSDRTKPRDNVANGTQEPLPGTSSSAAFLEFVERLELISKEKPGVIINTLSNIFAMRSIGNKTHGDLAEIGLSEFVNFFVYDYSCKHVGKDLFRNKHSEEDIVVTCKAGGYKNFEIPISIKAYGIGPLQLSTDKNERMFPLLEGIVGKDQEVCGPAAKQVMSNPVFAETKKLNVLPLVYDEKKSRCNIMPFDFQKAFDSTARIVFVPAGRSFDFTVQALTTDQHRKHPIYLFLDSDGKYLFEVRYGGASANALQRGMWTNTKTADSSLFRSITGGWVDYSDRKDLVQLIAVALNATASGHKAALAVLERDIAEWKNCVGLL